MRKWIEDKINPPGITKPKRGALFGLIGDVADQVKADATTAFNAHFPYLADSQKLEEHGKALGIPHLPQDTEEEFRNRVTTASFLLMRAGERGYIHEQLTEHFGNKYITTEQFLGVLVKVLDVTDEDRAWVLGFLDSLLDPNIKLTVTDWFHYVEIVAMKERLGIHTKAKETDTFRCGGLKHNGRAKYDGRTLNPTEIVPAKHDGEVRHDGSIHHNGRHTVWARSNVRLPFKHGSGVLDAMTLGINSGTAADVFHGRLTHSGSFKHDGAEKHGGYGAVQDVVITRSRSSGFLDRALLNEASRLGVVSKGNDRFFTNHRHDGNFKHDGSVRHWSSRERMRFGLSATLVEDVEIGEGFIVGMRSVRKHDGTFSHDGARKHNGGVLIPQ
jgi:hypothetical protein